MKIRINLKYINVNTSKNLCENNNFNEIYCRNVNRSREYNKIIL